MVSKSRRKVTSCARIWHLRLNTASVMGSECWPSTIYSSARSLTFRRVTGSNGQNGRTSIIRWCFRFDRRRHHRLGIVGFQHGLGRGGASWSVSIPSVWIGRDCRLPFVSRPSQANIVAGMVEREQTLVLEWLMPSGGVIFSDGIEADYLQFNAGSSVTVRAAEETAQLGVG